MSRRIEARRHVIGHMHEPADELERGRIDLRIHWLDDGNVWLEMTDTHGGLVVIEADQAELRRALGGYP